MKYPTYTLETKSFPEAQICFHQWNQILYIFRPLASAIGWIQVSLKFTFSECENSHTTMKLLHVTLQVLTLFKE